MTPCGPNERLVFEVQVNGWIERENLPDAEALEAQLREVLRKHKELKVKVQRVHVVDLPNSPHSTGGQ